MFTVVGIMGVGIVTGCLLRYKKISYIHRIITGLIWLLLFLLGLEAGCSKVIIEGLFTIGWDAAIIALAAVMGSVLCSWGLWYLINAKNKEASQ
ncbi:hypothetical protein EZS27_027021 [termite gut metagenome]|uniref:DUF340 domain-containing protein n=1 Tax=termite gut metagenome TaxID=433724 RepID=A0A5J4QR17_9ZZZZ